MSDTKNIFLRFFKSICRKNEAAKNKMSLPEYKNLFYEEQKVT